MKIKEFEKVSDLAIEIAHDNGIPLKVQEEHDLTNQEDIDLFTKVNEWLKENGELQIGAVQENFEGDADLDESVVCFIATGETGEVEDFLMENYDEEIQFLLQYLANEIFDGKYSELYYENN